MKRLLKGLCIFLTLAGVGIASALAVVALLLRQEEVRVPDLVGHDIVNVIDTLTRQGLLLKVDRREPSPTAPLNTVISQSPPAGEEIKKGRQVRVVVSQGPSGTQAPNVVGENFRKADIIIRQAGFVPGDVARAPSDSVERDLVLAQAPPAGSALERGGRVSILVSAGRPPQQFVMPALTGKTVADAGRILDRMGLHHRLLSRASTTLPQDRTVIAQKPASGYPVAQDAVVDMTAR